MPFKSEKQRRFMYARHPEIAKRWSEEEKQGNPMPKKKKRETREEALARFKREAAGTTLYKSPTKKPTKPKPKKPTPEELRSQRAKELRRKGTPAPLLRLTDVLGNQKKKKE